jgi:hypothetical protein
MQVIVGLSVLFAVLVVAVLIVLCFREWFS